MNRNWGIFVLAVIGSLTECGKYTKNSCFLSIRLFSTLPFFVVVALNTLGVFKKEKSCLFSPNSGFDNDSL